MKRIVLLLLAVLFLSGYCQAGDWLNCIVERALAADSTNAKGATFDTARSDFYSTHGLTQIKMRYAYKVDSVFTSDTVKIALYGYPNAAHQAGTFRRAFFIDTLTGAATTYTWSTLRIISTSDSAWMSYLALEAVFTDSLPGAAADTNIAGNTYHTTVKSELLLKR